MNRDQIREFLPHREPMLLVDETESDGVSGMGKYTVRGDEYFLQGHFPGNPIVPGVILCEIMAQCCAAAFKDTVKGKTPMFTGLNNVRIKKPVRPGDTFVVKFVLEKQKQPFYFFKTQGYVGDILSISGDFSFALV